MIVHRNTFIYSISTETDVKGFYHYLIDSESDKKIAIFLDDFFLEEEKKPEEYERSIEGFKYNWHLSDFVRNINKLTKRYPKTMIVFRHDHRTVRNTCRGRFAEICSGCEQRALLRSAGSDPHKT